MVLDLLVNEEVGPGVPVPTSSSAQNGVEARNPEQPARRDPNGKRCVDVRRVSDHHTVFCPSSQGHIKEFQAPSSRSRNVTATLKIVETEGIAALSVRVHAYVYGWAIPIVMHARSLSRSLSVLVSDDPNTQTRTRRLPRPTALPSPRFARPVLVRNRSSRNRLTIGASGRYLTSSSLSIDPAASLSSFRRRRAQPLAGAAHAFVCDADHGLPDAFAAALGGLSSPRAVESGGGGDGGGRGRGGEQHSLLHVHAHEHPATVLAAAPHPAVPAGCIALNEVQRLNCKVHLKRRGRKRRRIVEPREVVALRALRAVFFRVRPRYDEAARRS